jgi:NTE family protein
VVEEGHAAMNDGVNNLALALGGGGARAAYQVGFLRGLARAAPELRIPILTGVSAGAINAVFAANSRDSFPSAVERLTAIWEQLNVRQIFRSDPAALALNFVRWGIRLASGGSQLPPPTHGLVDTAPMRRFFCDAMQASDGMLTGIAENFRQGRLRSIGITTTNYTTGQTVTWVQGEGLTMWERAERRGTLTQLTVDHVMASCAVPILFPAIRLDREWHGDGSVRLMAPLSPALHLGAERILVISNRYQKSRTEADQPTTPGYPPPATVLGTLMNAVFLDMLDYDAIVLQRLNKVVRELSEEKRLGLREVELLVVRPSADLELIAADYEATLPRSFRHLVRGLGTRETTGTGLLAMVLFAPEYIRHLIRIGEQDAEHRREEVISFVMGQRLK